MTRFLYLQGQEGRPYLFCPSSSSLTPPLHLCLLPPNDNSNVHTDTQTSSSCPFLHALTTAPFWLNLTLPFLHPNDWLCLEATSSYIYHHLSSPTHPDTHTHTYTHTTVWHHTKQIGPFLTPSQKRSTYITRKENMHKMAQAWNRIEKFASRSMGFSLCEGVSEEEMCKFERSIRAPLPPDLRASYLLHNGQGMFGSGVGSGILGAGVLWPLIHIMLEMELTGGPLSVLPLDQPRIVAISAKGHRGIALHYAFPPPVRVKEGTVDEAADEQEEEVEGVGYVYLGTGHHLRKVANSWLEYLGTLR